MTEKLDSPREARHTPREMMQTTKSNLSENGFVRKMNAATLCIHWVVSAVREGIV